METNVILIVESEDGRYEPIAIVGSVDEARQAAQQNLARRMELLARGESPSCPYLYKIWAQTEGRWIEIEMTQ